jgi:hypothetical protein
MNYLPKVGETVAIRSDLDTGETYGSVKMLPEMEDVKGTTGKVTAVNEKERAVKVGDWWWSTAMLRLTWESILWSTVDKINEAGKTLDSIKGMLADMLV